MLTLTPQGRAVAAIVLAFLFVFGSLDRVGSSIVGVVDTNLGKDQFVIATIINLIVGLGVLLLAHRAATTATEQWAVASAQGARVLATIGIALTALALITLLVHDNVHGHYLGPVFTD